MTSSPVLGLETSCDETSAAVLSRGGQVLGHVILSQDVHVVYGGVVPELAARAHLARVDDVVDEALAQAGLTLADIGAIGVTAGPGLIGALLVGVAWAKAVAFGLDIPLIAVHHMEGHLFAPLLEDPGAEPPFVALLVSGGHTLLLYAPVWGRYHLLGRTRDDAAGEAFDKVAKLLSLPYPGGPQVEGLARAGTDGRYRLPRPMLRPHHRPGDPGYFDFSFSGLKTAVSELTAELGEAGVLDARRADVARAFQEAVVDVLCAKTLRAVEETGCSRVLLGGGVSANLRLRAELGDRLGEQGELLVGSPRLSLDNGAMIARAAIFHLEQGEVAGPDVSAHASMPLPGLIEGPWGGPQRTVVS